MIKEMCQEAGITGNFTNHSLRAFGASEMYQAGISEKIIQERTGHRSLQGLRVYERTAEAQLVDISKVMSESSSVTGLASVDISSEKASTSGCDSSINAGASIDNGHTIVSTRNIGSTSS